MQSCDECTYVFVIERELLLMIEIELSNELNNNDAVV